MCEKLIGSHNEFETALGGDDDYDDEKYSHEHSEPLKDGTLTIIHVEDNQDHDNNDLLQEIADMKDDGDQKMIYANQDVDSPVHTNNAIPLRQSSLLSHSSRFMF